MSIQSAVLDSEGSVKKINLEKKMIKTIFALLCVALVAGCASTSKWSSSYEPYSNSSDAPEIEVNLTTERIPGFVRASWHHNVQIFVEGNLALEAPIHEDYSGSLLFFFQQDRFELECVKPNFYSFPECGVQVNGRRAGKVAFGG